MKERQETVVGKKVMVIDDSSTIRQQVGIALTRSGYDVVEASDGVDGFEKIAANAGLAMVICDVNMPRMNGIEFLVRMNSQPPAQQLPVLMLTTEAQPNLIARAREAGAKGWIIKPFKPEMLLSAVRKLVGDV